MLIFLSERLETGDFRFRWKNTNYSNHEKETRGNKLLMIVPNINRDLQKREIVPGGILLNFNQFFQKLVLKKSTEKGLE